VLPASVPLRDAVFNLQRVALIVAAAHSGEESLLAGVFDDRLHQPFRQELVPGLGEVLKLRHPEILGAMLSGSGPSIAVLVRGEGSQAEALLNETYESVGVPFALRRLGVHRADVQVATTRSVSS
jgi:homoserine kinase